MEKIKILMVIAVFSPFIGGSEKQAKKLALELINNNIEITVITGRWNNLLKKYENIHNLKIIRNLTNLVFLKRNKLNKNIDFFKSYLAESDKRLNRVRIIIKKIFIRTSIYIYQFSLLILLIKQRKNYDLIHVHQILFPAYISSLAAKILNKPIIAKVGSSGFNSDINQIKKFPEGRLQLKFILNQIDKLVCTSKKMQKEFILEGMKDEKIVLIRNGVEVYDFRRSFHKCINLAYLGRFTKTKNIETLLIVFAKLINESNKDLKLFLIGDGTEKDNVFQLIKRLGLKDNIVFMGLVDNPEYYLKKSDLFVFPSLIEGLSNSLIEAMSYKLPCIVSNIPGNLELMGEDNKEYFIEKGKYEITKHGIIFNPIDQIGLFNAIHYLLNNQDMREKLGNEAYNRIKEEYDIKIIAKKYIDLYEEVLKN